MPTKSVFVPSLGHHVQFTNRALMKVGHPTRSFVLRDPLLLPSVTLPIDWTKNNTLSFPIDGNDTYGDCMYAAACHGDNTFTGNASTESVFNLQTIISDYLALSGGDHGLNEAQITGAWKTGLASTPAATILDVLDIDPTNASLCQLAIQSFGGILFMLSVPDEWISEFSTGCTWTSGAGIAADPSNGHGIWWNGVDTTSNYKLQTWGTYAWITPAGVAICDPSAFVVFSLRWFNSQGIAPNGMTYDQLAALWVEAGGAELPPSPFTPVPPAPEVLFEFATTTAIRAGQRMIMRVPVALPAGEYSVSKAEANSGVLMTHGLVEG